MPNKPDILTFLYKCRRCGMVFGGVAGNKTRVLQYLIELTVFGKVREPGSDGHAGNLRLYEVHNCKDGCLGVADMTGAGRSFS